MTQVEFHTRRENKIMIETNFERKNKWDNDYQYKNEDNVWSMEFQIDKLKQYLAMNAKIILNHKTGQITELRKYYLQVFDMQKIGALDRSMVKPFVIHLSDLPKKMIIELIDLNEKNRTYVLIQAVGRLFEDVNYQLYHNSISRILSIRLEK